MNKKILVIIALTTMTTFSPEPKNENSGCSRPSCTAFAVYLEKNPDPRFTYRNHVWTEQINTGEMPNSECEKLAKFFGAATQPKKTKAQ